MPFRIMKKILSALLLLLGIVAAHAQQPFKEFIYAQTDKNFYLAGERLWFKLYNLDENNRLMQGGSRVAYVQLVGDTPNTVHAPWKSTALLLPTACSNCLSPYQAAVTNSAPTLAICSIWASKLCSRRPYMCSTLFATRNKPTR